MGPRFGASCRSVRGCSSTLFRGTGCRGDEQARQENVSFSDGLGWSTRAARALAYVVV